MDDLEERLRTFEGSDDLGNGDFSVCRHAADRLRTYREALERIKMESGEPWAVNIARQAVKGQTMTSPVIEAMAKAIYDTAIDRRPLTPLGMCADYPEWGDLSDSDREHARAEATACLKALEENITDEMCNAATLLEVYAGGVLMTTLNWGESRDCFIAMLRAAREE